MLSLLAEVYEANHETPKALELLKRAVRLFPYAEQHYIVLGDLCTEHGAYDLGLEILAVGARNIPQSAAVRAMQGVIHAQLGHYEEAEAAFTEASRLDPNVRSAEVGRTLTLQEAGRIEESIRVIRAHLKEDPKDPTANFLLAQALIKRGIQPGQPAFEEALRALQLSIEGEPNRADAHVELGKLFVKSGETEDAAKHFQAAVELDPGHRTATYQLMRAWRKMGRSEEAAKLLTRLRSQLEQGMEDDIQTNRYRIVRGDPK